MKNYVYTRINVEDLQMLRNSLLVEKKQLQLDIIDALGEIYELVDESLEYSDLISKNYKYCVKSVTGFVKSLLFAVGSYVFCMNMLDKDPDFFYSFVTCDVATYVGWRLFQKDNFKENYVAPDVLSEAVDKYEKVFDKIQVLTERYYDKFRVYLDGEKNFVVKEEIEKMFSDNREYINKKKVRGEFKNDFSFELMNEIAEDYFDDKIMNDFLGFYEKDQQEEKQKQRKL